MHPFLDSELTHFSSSEVEKQRLAVLARYEVLDTPPEAAFDELAKLAATICETPIALVSLLDERREWLKARLGFEQTEIPRKFSFCARSSDSPAVFIVPDATRDSRFADHPLVTGEP